MDAAAEYSRRLKERRGEAARLAHRELTFSNVRLAIFAAAVLLAWLAFARGTLSPWWLVLPLIAFPAVAVVHARVIARRIRAERAAAFYERGLARIEDRWAGSGETGARFLDPAHPYAEDLDLFGDGSLFQLLCAARTRSGESVLASWLMGPAPPEAIRDRQLAVDELRRMIDLREDLACMGAEIGPGVDPVALRAWSATQPILTSGAARLAATALAAANVVTLVAWLADAGPIPFAAAAAATVVFFMRFRRGVDAVIAGVERPSRDLALLSQVLERFERESFTSPRLGSLRKMLDTGGDPPSRAIAKLARLVVLLDSRRNQLFAPVAGLLLWTFHLAHAIEKWRSIHGAAVAGWLEAVGELEALCSLAAYAFEHPGDPFPEIAAEGPRFVGMGMGHPLIAEGRLVRNDVRLGDGLRVLIVSGSNMSGKSTLLRTVGTNAVLALAGAPVRARSLTLSPLAVGASIRIHDSLQAGTSRFYAEITRLRQIADLARTSEALLFLLDEILHGTNSHDRRIGAESIVKRFVEKGGIGLVTTHDLALAQITGSMNGRAANVHFEDHIEGGRISFDYRLREGVVTKSNALELMRSVGLEV